MFAKNDGKSDANTLVFENSIVIAFISTTENLQILSKIMNTFNVYLPIVKKNVNE